MIAESLLILLVYIDLHTNIPPEKKNGYSWFLSIVNHLLRLFSLVSSMFYLVSSMFYKVSQTDESYIKRKNIIKRKISSSNKTHDAPKNAGGMLFSNTPNNFSTDGRNPEYLESSPPNFAPPYRRKSKYGKSKRPMKERPLQLEEWTEKLLEEARDDLEMVDVGVQTEQSLGSLTPDTRVQACQTKEWVGEATAQVTF